MTRYEALAVIEAIRATPEGGERYETLFGTELMALDSLPTIRLIYLAKLLENSWKQRLRGRPLRKEGRVRHRIGAAGASHLARGGDCLLPWRHALHADVPEGFVMDRLLDFVTLCFVLAGASKVIDSCFAVIRMS